MKHLKVLRILCLIVALSVGLMTSSQLFAQTETVRATFVTTSTITTVDVADMDFGTYFVIVGGADNPTFTLTDDNTTTVTVADDANSTVTEIVAAASEGQVTVETPAAVTLTMTRSASGDFTDPNLSLTATTFRTASENGNIDADTDNDTITVLAGSTPEVVRFGGTITATDTPGDATHSAQFNVTFAF